jgi:Uri superfamily endonuclease
VSSCSRSKNENEDEDASVGDGMVASSITILGGPHQSGIYVLGLTLAAPLHLALGRFADGQPIDFPAGDYLYVGSALAQRGATSLAPRLLRHATRSGDQPAQSLRPLLYTALIAAGLGGPTLRPPANKRCFWHIDYLLDQPTVVLTRLYALRTLHPMEETVAHLLLDDPHTFVVAPGIGAQDYASATHLLGVRADKAWWTGLGERLAGLVAA